VAPDVIVGSSTPVIAAMKQATSSFPIIMAAVNDPVDQGFVSGLHSGRLKGTLLDDSRHYCEDREFHPLALPVVGVISDSSDDRGNRRW